MERDGRWTLLSSGKKTCYNNKTWKTQASGSTTLFTIPIHLLEWVAPFFWRANNPIRIIKKCATLWSSTNSCKRWSLKCESLCLFFDSWKWRTRWFDRWVAWPRIFRVHGSISKVGSPVGECPLSYRLCIQTKVPGTKQPPKLINFNFNTLQPLPVFPKQELNAGNPRSNSPYSGCISL